MKKHQTIYSKTREDKMKCPKCDGKMLADVNGKYGIKLYNSTLYVCTSGGCGKMVRKNREPRLPKQHKPLTGQPLLPLEL